MKSFLYLSTILLIAQSTFSYSRSIHGCCPFLMFEQMEHAILKNLSDIEQKIQFETAHKQLATLHMNEKDDFVELVFKSEEFLKPESNDTESVTLSKQYNALNILTCLCLKANSFSATIKQKLFEDGTGLCVTISENQSDNHSSYSSYERKQIIIPALLETEKVSAEFDKKEGTIKVIIPKNSVNIQVAQNIVPITVVPEK